LRVAAFAPNSRFSYPTPLKRRYSCILLEESAAGALQRRQLAVY
jgi:hypothetical protein